MTPKEKKYRPEFALELLRIARGDLESAKFLSPTGPGRLENICYLTQQCIEKCLKAVMCHIQVPVVHTHDLETLINLIPHTHRPPNSHELIPLTEYATVRRYEEGYEILSPEDIKNVLELGKKTLEWAEKKCSK